MAQVGEQHPDIGKLRLDFIPALVYDLGHVGVLGPDEVLQQLGRLHRQGGGKASRVVKLLPVTLGNEGARGVPDLDQVRHTGEYAAPPQLRKPPR